MLGTAPFRVSLDGKIKTPSGYLIGIPENTDMNPLSDNYGQEKEAAKVVKPESDVMTTFSGGIRRIKEFLAVVLVVAGLSITPVTYAGKAQPVIEPTAVKAVDTAISKRDAASMRKALEAVRNNYKAARNNYKGDVIPLLRAYYNLPVGVYSGDQFERS